MKIFLSEQALGVGTGVPLDHLREIADHPAANYKEFSRWKDATRQQARMIRNPRDDLKHIQRLIKRRVFGNDAFGPEVQGGISGAFTEGHAEKHLGAQVLVSG